MALPIHGVPTLKGKEAKAFLDKMAAIKPRSIDFTKQAEMSRKLLERSKF